MRVVPILGVSFVSLSAAAIATWQDSGIHGVLTVPEYHQPSPDEPRWVVCALVDRTAAKKYVTNIIRMTEAETDRPLRLLFTDYIKETYGLSDDTYGYCNSEHSAADGQWRYNLFSEVHDRQIIHVDWSPPAEKTALEKSATGISSPEVTQRRSESTAEFEADARAKAREAREAEYQRKLAEYNRLNAERDAAIKRAQEQEEANRRQLEASKNRVNQADAQFENAFDKYKREVNQRLDQIKQQQQTYLDQIYANKPGSKDVCRPVVAGTASAWMDTEGDAMANLHALASSNCGLRPSLSNISCSSANFNLPMPGKARSTKLSYQCTATCTVQRCSGEGAAATRK